MSMSPKRPTLTVAQLLDTPEGVDVNVAIEIEPSDGGLLRGRVIEPDSEEPFSRYRRSDLSIEVRWGDETKVVMGTPSGLVVGAPVWVTGVTRADDSIDATLLALLAEVAEVEG